MLPYNSSVVPMLTASACLLPPCSNSLWPKKSPGPKITKGNFGHIRFILIFLVVLMISHRNLSLGIEITVSRSTVVDNFT